MSEADSPDSGARPPQNVASTASIGTGTPAPGGQIGPYRLVQVLGEGGSATVCLARQQRPVRREVATKIVKAWMDSASLIARFEAERQALALLNHPNIAQVFDAGTTETGRPYFVMEYVKGIPITEHCDRHKLSIEERLELFLRVCDAVQHAHQKGIIHRDIKPSNILVSLEGRYATPKVIDLGIAKAISQPLTERTLHTELGQLIGTPEYMSPEQAEMTSQDIDTRTDVYSLGVVLIAGIVTTSLFAIRAERQGQTSQAVADFLTRDLLGLVDPNKAKGGDVSVRYILDGASKGLQGKFKNEPLVEASIRQTLGDTYIKLGEWRLAPSRR